MGGEGGGLLGWIKPRAAAAKTHSPIHRIPALQLSYTAVVNSLYEYLALLTWAPPDTRLSVLASTSPPVRSSTETPGDVCSQHHPLMSMFLQEINNLTEWCTENILQLKINKELIAVLRKKATGHTPCLHWWSWCGTGELIYTPGNRHNREHDKYITQPYPIKEKK